MNSMDKSAMQTAALTAGIVLAVFEALSFLVQLIDPQGGILRVNLRNPLHHVIIAAAALGFGVFTYVRERRKSRNRE